MVLNIRDAYPYGQSWYIKDAESAERTNYIYDSGEDYFFGSSGPGNAHIDTLIINDSSENWNIETHPQSGFTFVNPTNSFIEKGTPKI